MFLTEFIKREAPLEKKRRIFDTNEEQERRRKKGV